MNKPLNLETVCAWLRSSELEFHQAQALVQAIASAVKARCERRCDTKQEILDKTEALDIAADAMDHWQMEEQPFEHSAAEQYRQAVDFARAAGLL